MNALFFLSLVHFRQCPSHHCDVAFYGEEEKFNNSSYFEHRCVRSHDFYDMHSSASRHSERLDPKWLLYPLLFQGYQTIMGTGFVGYGDPFLLFVCKMVNFAYYFSFNCSILSMLAIGTERLAVGQLKVIVPIFFF